MTIPIIKLDLERVFRKGDTLQGVKGIDSEVNSYGYLYDEREVAILSRDNGYIRIKKNDLRSIIEELEWIDQLQHTNI